jgi:NADPH:quinone reductase-like Zn-dependent oxidoreductase
MKAIVIEKQAPKGPVTPNIRVVDDWAEPAPPGPGEARLRTICTALNHLDLWLGMGLPHLDTQYPFISGSDVCAEVESVGEGVSEEWLGRKVILNAAMEVPRTHRPEDPSEATYAPDLELLGENHLGVNRAHFNAPVANLAAVDDADEAEAAAFGLSFLTAYSMMIGKGDLRPGQHVLITGIGGGVATAALGLARWMGCTTIVTSRHRWKLDRALELGADHGVLDEGQDWSREVRGLTNKRGVDMVVDTVGGPLLKPSLRVLVSGGAFVTAGATAGPVAEIELARVFWKQLRVLGSTMGSNDEFREVMALFRAGHVAPVVDRVFPPAEAPAAWERLEAADQMGKLAIDWR